MTDEDTRSKIEKILGKRSFAITIVAVLIMFFGLLGYLVKAEQPWTLAATGFGVLGMLVKDYVDQVSTEKQLK